MDKEFTSLMPFPIVFNISKVLIGTEFKLINKFPSKKKWKKCCNRKKKNKKIKIAKMKTVKFMMKRMNLKWTKKKLKRKKKKNKTKIAKKFNLKNSLTSEDPPSVVEVCLADITYINNSNNKNLKNLTNTYLFVKLLWVNIKL